MFDDFNIPIVSVISETPYWRTVKVELVQDFYDGRKIVTLGFMKGEWEIFKQKGSFPERRSFPAEDIRYFEDMSNDEWYRRRFETKIIQFSNEELIGEVNRRLRCSAISRLKIGQIELSTYE